MSLVGSKGAAAYCRHIVGWISTTLGQKSLNPCLQKVTVLGGRVCKELVEVK